MLAELEPYIDGYFDSIGEEITVIPRVKFPFKSNPIAQDTYSRLYERDFYIFPGSPPRVDMRTAWTNLLTYSEDVGNAAWTKTNLGVTSNSVIAPDGLVTMDKLLETTTNAEHSAAQAATVTAAPHEVSFFIKGGLTRTFVRGAFTDSAATVFSAFFSTSGYVISPSTGTTAKIVNLGNGHFHCVLRFTPAAGAGTVKVNTSTDGSTISFAGSTTAGIYLWGAQVALGSVAPYVSTLGAVRSILAPDRDPRDPLAYLLAESDPEPVNSHRQRVTRIFGRIPRTQVITGSRSIPKPRIGGTFPRVINGKLVFHPDPDSDEWHFYARVAVINDSGAPVSSTTGGTFSLTFDGDTASSIAWNASNSTVDSGLDGLASVTAYGGVAVTGSHTAGYSAAFSYSQAAIDVSSLVVNTGIGGTATATVVRTENGLTQNVTITPYWDSANVSGASSFTPGGANPIAVGNSTGDKTGGISFQIGNSSGSGATGGTFTLTVYGQTTGTLNWNDSIGTFQTALNALSEVSDRGNYTVASAGLANGVQVYSATFPNATLTSGTFTVTLFGQTTGTIAYNASLATIASAINALSEVTARGGCTVTGVGFAGGKMSFAINMANIPAITGSAASLTPTGNISITSTVRGSVQTISFSTTPTTLRILTAPGHGVTGTESIIVNTSTVTSAGYSVIDASTIALNAGSGLLNYGSVIAYIGAAVETIYAADSPEIPVDFVSYYFFPGVTANIDEVSDFPIPARGTPAQLLGAIFSGATLFNYETGSIAQWNDTPVHSLTLQTINPQHLISPALL